MSLLVTPEPTHTPPRVRIDMAIEEPDSVFTSLTLTRDGRPVRTQPPVGGEESVTYDYEAPFGTEVTYQLESTPSAYTSSFTESWASLTGWTTTSGSPEVSGGSLRKATGPSSTAWVERTLSIPNVGMVDVGSMSVSGEGQTQLIVGGPGGINYTRQYVYSFGVWRTYRRLLINGGEVDMTLTEDADHIFWSPDGVTAVGISGARYSTDVQPILSNKLMVRITEGGTMGGFSLYEAADGPPSVETATTTLHVDEAWLIHPSQPTLSVSIDPGAGRWRPDGLNVDPTTEPETALAARRNEYAVIGRKRSIYTTTGPRAAGEWTLVLLAPRAEDKAAALAVIDDQTTLLLRSPAAWPWDLPDGWYSIGDVTVARISKSLVSPGRRITLPLSPTDPPVVRVAAVRTWGDVLLENASWASLTQRYETWLDVLTGDEG